MLLFDPPSSWKLANAHRVWLFPCLVIGLAAFLWYAVSWFLASEQPGGSSLPGLTCGILAGVLMLYLLSYALRKVKGIKKLFSILPTNSWLRQHIWLGLLTVPLVAVHAARISHWGTLTIWLIVTYSVVIVSGVWGLILQQRLPTRLLEDIPDETIPSQVPELTEQLRQEAELLVLATCGPPAISGSGAPEVPGALRKHLGVIRAARSGKGTGLLAVLPAEPIPDSEPLRRYFTETVDPYLRPAAVGRSKLFLRARIEKDFRDLRGRLPAAALPVIEALRDVCERRRQFDEQARLHRWLHTWISFHLVASSALFVLLCSHVITAILYW